MVITLRWTRRALLPRWPRQRAQRSRHQRQRPQLPSRGAPGAGAARAPPPPRCRLRLRGLRRGPTPRRVLRRPRAVRCCSRAKWFARREDHPLRRRDWLALAPFLAPSISAVASGTRLRRGLLVAAAAAVAAVAAAAAAVAVVLAAAGGARGASLSSPARRATGVRTNTRASLKASGCTGRRTTWLLVGWCGRGLPSRCGHTFKST